MEQKNSIWRLSVAVALGIVLARFLSGELVSAILPFFVAYVAARIMRPLGVRISAACHVNERVGCAVYAVVVCSAAGYFAVFASGRLISAVEGLALRIPEYAQAVRDLIGAIYERFPVLSGSHVLPIVSDLASEAVTYVGSAVASSLGEIVQSLGGGAVSTVFGVVAFVYLTSDMSGALAGVRRLIPNKYADRVCRTVSRAESAVFAYFRSCLTLMAVTFFVLLIGLGCVGVRSPFALALVIAFIDALPVLGCGTVLVPWAVWSFVVGSIGLGAGLLIVFLVTYLVRQFLEPRLIGRMTGAHPFVAFAAVCIGFRIAGIAGLILTPVGLILLSERGSEGVF